jgi:AcrR family transcriptional regulator
MGERATQTRQLILDTARELFMAHGYGGTTIDRIAKSAGISRASVYTYYPTKRDVLLATGETSFADGEAVIARLGEISAPARVGDLEKWAQDYLDFLEQRGAFVLVLSQAAIDDPDLRKVGVREYRRTGRKLAAALSRLGAAGDDEVPVNQAFAVLAVIERFAMWKASGMPLAGDDAAATVARTIHAVLAGA